MKVVTEKGFIEISNEVFTGISGAAAMNCFGVKAMAVRTVADGIVGKVRKEFLSKGVKVEILDNSSANIELHIIVEHGVNIAAVSRSIMSEVAYVVEDRTGVKVSRVDVFVDSMTV